MMSTELPLLELWGNTIYDLGEDLDLALEYLDVVRDLYRDEDEIFAQHFPQRTGIYIAINNASVIFSYSNRIEDLERNLVDRKWHKIPYLEVREIISGLLYPRIVYNNQIEERKIFILYALRYHLDDEQKKNIVELITIDYLTSKVRTLCTHGSEGLKFFLDEIKSLIEKSEIIFLANSILNMLSANDKKILLNGIAEWSEYE